MEKKSTEFLLISLIKLVLKHTNDNKKYLIADAVLNFNMN